VVAVIKRRPLGPYELMIPQAVAESKNRAIPLTPLNLRFPEGKLNYEFLNFESLNL
jgi:hypothetical protein